MARADDAIGIAFPTVAHKIKHAKHKFFIEFDFLKMQFLKRYPQNHAQSGSLPSLDAKRTCDVFADPALILF